MDFDDGESQADALVRIGSAGTLFSDSLGAGYARITVDDHAECWPLRSKGFRRWLTGAYFAETGRAPNGEAITNALNVLEAKAQFGGPSSRFSFASHPTGRRAVPRPG